MPKSPTLKSVNAPASPQESPKQEWVPHDNSVRNLDHAPVDSSANPWGKTGPSSVCGEIHVCFYVQICTE